MIYRDFRTHVTLQTKLSRETLHFLYLPNLYIGFKDICVPVDFSERSLKKVSIWCPLLLNVYFDDYSRKVNFIEIHTSLHSFLHKF